MKNFCLVFPLALVLFIGVPVPEALSATYEDRSIGIRIELPAQWELYTEKEKAPEHLRSAFSKREGQNKPLFLAVHASQQAFGRLLMETFSGTVTDYFDMVYVQQKDQIDIVRARYDVLNDVVQWEFRTRAGKVGLTFIETIAKQGGSIVRLGFWTFTSLIEKYRPMFGQVAEETALLGEGLKGAQWAKPWLNLRKNLEGADIDYIALAKPLPAEAAVNCAGEKRAALWKVKGAKNTVSLFGSIHLGRPDFYSLAPEVESSFDHSGHLVVELDPTSDAFKKEVAQFMERSRLPEGKTLHDVVSPGVYRKLTETLERLGIPLDGMERLKPEVMALVLTAMQLQSMGYMPDFGADQYFIERAKKGKAIVELESFDEQMRLFESLGQERFLAYTLLSLNVMEVKSGHLITAWRCGDLKTMQTILFEDLTSNMIDNTAEIYEKLFFSRNRKMADKIKTYLQKGGDYFVVVGAGHLVGNKSIVDLLRTEGYTVTGP